MGIRVWESYHVRKKLIQMSVFWFKGSENLLRENDRCTYQLCMLHLRGLRSGVSWGQKGSERTRLQLFFTLEFFYLLPSTWTKLTGILINAPQGQEILSVSLGCCHMGRLERETPTDSWKLGFGRPWKESALGKKTLGLSGMGSKSRSPNIKQQEEQDEWGTEKRRRQVGRAWGSKGFLPYDLGLFSLSLSLSPFPRVYVCVCTMWAVGFRQ